MTAMSTDPEPSIELRSILEALAHAPDWPVETPFEIAPGDRIGRYTLERVIGRGGFGVVFAARDEALGRRVAIKVTRGAPTPEVLARFEHEGKIAARLNHPNLVTLYDSGTIEDLPFLVLELLDGETLAERLARGPLDNGRALAIIADVTRALVPVHAAGIVHLDLKPSNVFITTDGRVKVLDFGLARLRDGVDGRRGGTPGYMAPEQIRGDAPDGRADVFAVGVMLAEMIPTATAAIRAIGERARAATAAERFPGAPDLLAAIDAVRAPSRRWRWIGAAAVAIAAIAVVVGARIYSQRAATQAAYAGEQAGREARDIVAELRDARLRPLHDLGPDLQRARDRVHRLADTIAAGDGGDAAELALADAERALQELPQARARLERVLAHDRSPAAIAAHGEILLDQYDQLAHDTMYDADPDRRAAELADLDRTLRAPALKELAEVGATSPLALARIAVYERRYADARKLAGEALAAQPGVYEADVVIAEASRVEGAIAAERGDHATVIAAVARADEAYARASAIARSDSAVYMLDCRALASAMLAHGLIGDEPTPSYEAAQTACGRALAAMPDGPDVVTDATMLRVTRGIQLAEREDRVAEALPVFDEALALAGRAHAAHPDDPDLSRLTGVVLMARGYAEGLHGDPRASYGGAIAVFLDAQRLRPTSDAAERLGMTYVQLAQYEIEHGIDPSPHVDSGLASLPHRESVAMLGVVGSALEVRARWQLAHGVDPRPALDDAIAALDKIRAQRPTDGQAIDEEGSVWQTRGAWEREHGLDPIPSLDRAIECTETLLVIDASDHTAHNNLAEELIGRADAEHARGGVFTPFVTRAIEHAKRANELAPSMPEPLDNLGLIYERAARWTAEAGADPSADIAAARQALEAAQALGRDDAFVRPIEADLQRDRERWQAAKR